MAHLWAARRFCQESAMFETPILDIVTVLVICCSSMVDFSLTESIAISGAVPAEVRRLWLLG